MNEMLMPSAGSVVLITGAVGNLGVATARAMQKTGHRTILVDRSSERLGAAFANIADSSDHLLAGSVDLTNPDSIGAVVAKALARFGRIDVLVNTVGGWRGGKPVHESALADWDYLLDLNFRTTLLCCRAVIPQMLKQGHGSIVNVASRDGLAGSPGYAAYSISKSAVIRLTEALGGELKASNINVNCILPGTIDTPQNRTAMPQADFGKWVEPAALADVIVFLSSSSARAINGAAIPVFGKA